jgi:hypothetical protein
MRGLPPENAPHPRSQHPPLSRNGIHLASVSPVFDVLHPTFSEVRARLASVHRRC